MKRYLSQMLWLFLLVGCTAAPITPTPEPPNPTPEPTPRPTISPTETPLPAHLYVSHTMRIAFELPFETRRILQEPVDTALIMPEPFRSTDQAVQVAGVTDATLTLEEVCAREAAGEWISEGYGENPRIEELEVEGQPACLVLPASDATQLAAMVIRYAEPVMYTLMETSFAYVIVRAHPQHIESITSTLRFEINPSEYLASVIDYMEQTSMYQEGVDWDSLRQEVLKPDLTQAGAHAAIVEILGKNGDFHAHLFDAAFVKRVMATDAGSATVEMPSGKLLPGNIGYIKLTGAFGNAELANAYASAAQGLIREIDQSRPCGWIVDVRGNGGGNMYPMLVGIGPVLGGGRSYAGESLTEFSSGSYENGQFLMDGQIRQALELSEPPYTLATPMPPVAVLTDGTTGSSGEIVAVAFRGRPDTRSFGAPTAGFTTGIADLELFDGSMLGISTSWYVDRTDTAYRGVPIPPDVLTENPYSEAQEWLAKQPTCMVNP